MLTKLHTSLAHWRHAALIVTVAKGTKGTFEHELFQNNKEKDWAYL